MFLLGMSPALRRLSPHRPPPAAAAVLLVLLLVVVGAEGFTQVPPVTPVSSTPFQWPSSRLSKKSVSSTLTSSKTDVVSVDNESSSLSSQKPLLLLDQALYGNTTAASMILEDINQLRRQQQQQQQQSKDENTTTTTTTALVDTYLDGLVPERRPSRWHPWFARWFPGARRASLRRTLDRMTPPSEEGARGDETTRRRRAFLVLLRALTEEDDNNKNNNSTSASLSTKRGKIPAIRNMERRARQEQKEIYNNNYTDMINRRPEGLETPNYEVLCSLRRDIEVRKYEPFTVCTVEMQEGKPGAFNSLAGYLFGKNQQSQAMKMTTPVLTQPNNQKMSFVLPSDYWGDIQKAPQPFRESGVELQTKEGEERAVILFGGYASSQQIQKKKDQLFAALNDAKSDWSVKEGDTATVAQYNDPFTPPWKRLNEVSIAVVKRK